MPATVVDLREYAGQWIAQDPKGEVVEAAPSYPELEGRLRERKIDVRSVAITEVPKQDGLLLL
jgi:Family of unknown function (DUF5678)